MRASSSHQQWSLTPEWLDESKKVFLEDDFENLCRLHMNLIFFWNVLVKHFIDLLIYGTIKISKLFNQINLLEVDFFLMKCCFKTSLH